MKTVSTLGLACVLACAFVACGGSGGDGGAGMGAAGGGATPVTGGMGGMGGSGAGTSGAAGVPGMTMVPDMMVPMMVDMTMPGMGEEGNPCKTTDATSCKNGLVCSKLPDPFDGVCGRPCMEASAATDCTMPDEVCSAYLEVGPGICLNLVHEWDVFRFQDTSACDDTTNPVLESDPTTMQPLPGGLCFTICLLDGADLMSLPMDAQAAVRDCAADQACSKDIVTFGDMLPIGVCAGSAKRGEDCGFVEMGILCADESDTCGPSDLMDLRSPGLCYQDCTMAGTTCDAGTCTEVKDEMGKVLGSICVP